MSLICFVAGAGSCLLFETKKKEEVKSSEQKESASRDKNWKSSVKTIIAMFDFSIAKEWRFLLWCMADILMEAAYNIPNYFLPCM